MIFLACQLISQHNLPLQPLASTLHLHLLDPLSVDQLHLLHAFLSFDLLLLVELGPLFLFQSAFGLDKLLLLLASLLGHLNELKSVILRVLQIELVLLMLLRSLDQLVLILLLFVLV